MGLVRTFEGSWEAREAAALGDDTGKVGARVWRVRRQRNNESRLGLGRKSLGAGGEIDQVAHWACGGQLIDY